MLCDLQSLQLTPAIAEVKKPKKKTSFFFCKVQQLKKTSVYYNATFSHVGFFTSALYVFVYKFAQRSYDYCHYVLFYQHIIKMSLNRILTHCKHHLLVFSLCERKKQARLRLTKASSVDVKPSCYLVSGRFASTALTSCSSVVSTDENFIALLVSQI